jgi:hypothetical protein
MIFIAPEPELSTGSAPINSTECILSIYLVNVSLLYPFNALFVSSPDSKSKCPLIAVLELLAVVNNGIGPFRLCDDSFLLLYKLKILISYFL